MKVVALVVTVVMVWFAAAVLWMVGWWTILILSVRFGPQDPFDTSIDIWLKIGVVVMSGLVVLAAIKTTGAIARRLI